METALEKSTSNIKINLDYEMTYNNKRAHCSPSKTVLSAKSVNYVLIEDSTFDCKLTTVGKSNAFFSIVVDFIDLDYGIIGGFYSFGLSGPASGGKRGYTLFKFTKNGFPVKPRYIKKKFYNKDNAKAKKRTQTNSRNKRVTQTSGPDIYYGFENVAVSPLKHKKSSQ